MKLPQVALAVSILGFPGAASAMFFGTDQMSSCTDANGNSYTVNRMGSTTIVNGSNPDGSDWSETSQTMGNMTITNGLSNGQPWNMTRQDLGGMTTYSGTNAAGEPFNHVCGTWGCN